MKIENAQFFKNLLSAPAQRGDASICLSFADMGFSHERTGDLESSNKEPEKALP